MFEYFKFTKQYLFLHSNLDLIDASRIALRYNLFMHAEALLSEKKQVTPKEELDKFRDACYRILKAMGSEACE